jgi:hypothetical protein
MNELKIETEVRSFSLPAVAPFDEDGAPFNAARYPDEAFSTYQLRRWNENRFYKILQSPMLVWDSHKNGTYRKADQKDKFTMDVVA